MAAPSAKPVRVLFVCLGNICRSPAAQGVTEHLVAERGLQGLVEVDSAGTGGWHVGDLPDRRMRLHARARGLELTHRARRVSEADFGRFDIIVAMDAANADHLRALAPTPEAAAKVVMMMDYASPGARYDHVPDPYYEGSEGFELVLDLLADACGGLLDAITRGGRR